VTVEVPGPIPDQPPSERQRLEALILITLEAYDGLCLDTVEERHRLATILTSAIVTAVKEEAEVIPQEIKQEQKRSRWPEPTTERPDLETLEEWEFEDGGCEATDGCWVEPDGVCEHGHPSWLLRLGYI
jgi:hypothetical protein